MPDDRPGQRRPQDLRPAWSPARRKGFNGLCAAASQCLNEGCPDIDKNAVENIIRPAKVGLKNYLFIGNAEGGQQQRCSTL